MSTAGSVLAVSRHGGNLRVLAEFLTRQGYGTVAGASFAEMERELAAADGIHAAVVDAEGFGGGLWQCCERLRSSDIPFIVVVSPHHCGLGRESLAHGAHCVLAKPLDLGELRSILESLFISTA